MALQIGQTLQTRYRIDALLGQGGMGAVYKAFDTRLNNYCAVKEMLPDPTASAQALQQARAQFQKEAQVLASLDHPNLPRVRDYFSLWGNEYLVMDFVEGENLEQVMARVGGALGEQQVLAWADQILDALEYLHEQQPFAIIHRDVKPLNIILTPNGKVKLVDFGLVKLLDPNAPRTATIMRGRGTPEYAPLEQFAGGMHTDARSDIFSLGATLYHLLTGQPPVEVHQRMLNVQQLAPPRQLNPYVSARTEQALLRALEVYPDKRWQTAREMRGALARPTAGAPQGIWRYGLAGAGAMALLLLGIWGVRGWFAPRPSATATMVVVAPSATLTIIATDTLAPPTATRTSRLTDTATPVPPTVTRTSRPTDTATPVPPTATRTPRPTDTATSVPPTATRTPRPTDTATPVPPTATNTPIPSAMTVVRLTLVTGSEGTLDNPVFELMDIAETSLYSTILDQPEDLQAYSTTVYEFIVPVVFCRMVEFHLVKPVKSSGDDSWDLKELYLSLNGIEVFFDRAVDFSFPYYEMWGGWGETEVYKTRCD